VDKIRTDGNQFESLIERVQHRAAQAPHYPAFEYLVDGEELESVLSYADLDQQAKKIAACLQTNNAYGERVLLLFPPGLEYVTAFFGCLFSGAIAVPAYPPDVTRLERSLPRLVSIVNNAKPGFVLTTTPILSTAQWVLRQYPELQNLKWLAADQILQESAEQSWHHPYISPDTLAFLQYTSGSTAEPKGVMVAHGNLMSNMRMIAHAFEADHSRDRGMFWLPSYHDMGLIGGILTTVNEGATTTLMSPLDFLQRPYRWLQAISRKRATISGGPNFAYDLCARKITSEQKQSLDLSCWQLAANGAEPVRPETMVRFFQTFESCGFREEAFFPCYGLAEATLLVTGVQRHKTPKVINIRKSVLGQNLVELVDSGDLDATSLASCGEPRLDEKIVIVDPVVFTSFEPDAGGNTSIGEIWIQGSNVAEGYWNNLEETERTFHAHLRGSVSPHYLRTGDLGFLRNGELFIAGRIKDIIIIDGLNHFPQDIELTVEKSHPALRPGCSAAFSVDRGDGEQLVIVVEMAKEKNLSFLQEALGVDISHTAVENAIRESISQEHNLAVLSIVLLTPGNIPKTSSGKIQRNACKEDFLKGNLETW
jgi:acyl-CoA synthetase (AMP-forming)/AMP-acid ligase II